MLSTRLDSEAAVLNTMPSLTSRCLEIWEETDVHTAMMSFNKWSNGVMYMGALRTHWLILPKYVHPLL